MAKKKRKSVREEMLGMLEREDIREMEGGSARQQILLAIVQKALNGDLKSVEFILELIGELPDRKGKPDGDLGLRIELGPGVEELAK